MLLDGARCQEEDKSASSFLRRSSGTRKRKLKHEQHQQQLDPHQDARNNHGQSHVRRLWGLTDEETEFAIETRHNSDPIERNVEYNIFFRPTPAPTSSPTVAPTMLPSSVPSMMPSGTAVLESEAPSISPSGGETQTSSPTNEPVDDTASPSSRPSSMPTMSAAPSESDFVASDAPSQTPSQSQAPSPAVGGELTLDLFLRTTLTDDGSLDAAGTAQNSAFTTLAASNPELDPNNVADQPQILQRYALNTLYFSTDGPNWVNNNGWTSASPLCSATGGGNGTSWLGVSCGPTNEVLIVRLGLNDLFGSLPSELRALSSLGERLQGMERSQRILSVNSQF